MPRHTHPERERQKRRARNGARRGVDPTGDTPAPPIVLLLVRIDLLDTHHQVDTHQELTS